MTYTKYPRTYHLPWSPGATSDDKVLVDTRHFEGKRVIITEKMDGENTTMYCDHIHARSLDSKGGLDRDWVKGYWSTIAGSIAPGWRVCGENLWAKHSIHYKNLKSFFYGFGVWDETWCISWDETVAYFDAHGITSVPVLYDGIWDDRIEHTMDIGDTEGYVVRLAEEFHADNFIINVAKYVRPNHVQTDEHWRNSIIIPNKLAVDSGVKGS